MVSSFPARMPDSVIHDEAVVLRRVGLLLREGIVITYDGKSLPMRPHSILVHGDTPGAVALARAVRREIETSGGTGRPDIAPPARRVTIREPYLSTDKPSWRPRRAIG